MKIHEKQKHQKTSQHNASKVPNSPKDDPWMIKRGEPIFEMIIRRGNKIVTLIMHFTSSQKI